MSQPLSSSELTWSSVCWNYERIRLYVVSCTQTRQRVAVSTWRGLTVRQLTYPGTAVARLIEEARRSGKVPYQLLKKWPL